MKRIDGRLWVLIFGAPLIVAAWLFGGWLESSVAGQRAVQHGQAQQVVEQHTKTKLASPVTTCFRAGRNGRTLCEVQSRNSQEPVSAWTLYYVELWKTIDPAIPSGWAGAITQPRGNELAWR